MPRPASFNHASPSRFFVPPLGPLLRRVRQRRAFLISGERLRRLEGTRPRGPSRDEGRNEIERSETTFLVRSQLPAEVTLASIAFCTVHVVKTRY